MFRQEGIKISDQNKGNQNSYVDKQTINYARLLKKLINAEPIHIVCQGDSMTYGHDTESNDIRPKKSDPTCESASAYPDHEQAGKTYPEALQEFCDIMYGEGKVKITNRGFSGDWAEMSRKRWNINPHADLHFIMLGTNDASNPFIPLDVQQDITKYIEDMGKLIEQILDFQSAIVLLTPPRHSIENNLLIIAYRQALKLIGKKYCIPVIDSTEFLNAYPYQGVQSDEVHYNTKGYTIFASKVASLLAGINHIYEPFTVHSNTELKASFHEYGITFKRNGSNAVMLEEINANNELDDNRLLFHIPSETNVTISFYANDHHLVVTPLFDIQNEEGILNFKLDFDINGDRQKSIANASNTTNLTYKGITSRFRSHNEEPSVILKNSFLLPTKGFYSITMENLGKADDIYVEGFIVQNYRSYV